MKKKRTKDPIAVALGKRGGKARAKQLNAMTKAQRIALARKAAEVRWAKKKRET